MADKIVACNKILDGTNVIQYDLSYEVENGALKNQFCVTVLGSAMTDATDEDEAVAKGNVKAKAIKDARIADLPEYSSADVPAVVGDVSLT